MIIKKIIVGIFLTCFLSGCGQNAALLGPAYSLVTSGNIYQAGLAYGSNEIITKSTGKSTAQNFKEIITPKSDDTEFRKLVKRNIEKTRKKLNLPNQ